MLTRSMSQLVPQHLLCQFSQPQLHHFFFLATRMVPSYVESVLDPADPAAQNEKKQLQLLQESLSPPSSAWDDPFDQTQQLLMSRHRRWSATTIYRQVRGILLGCALVLAVLFTFSGHGFQQPDRWSSGLGRTTWTLSGLTSRDSPAVLARASMLYGKKNEYLEKAIATQEMHSLRHGYPMSILQHSVTTGYWNKLTHLLSIIVAELNKEPDERIEWIMYAAYHAHPRNSHGSESQTNSLTGGQIPTSSSSTPPFLLLLSYHLPNRRSVT